MRQHFCPGGWSRLNINSLWGSTNWRSDPEVRRKPDDWVRLSSQSRRVGGNCSVSRAASTGSASALSGSNSPTSFTESSAPLVTPNRQEAPPSSPSPPPPPMILQESSSPAGCRWSLPGHSKRNESVTVSDQTDAAGGAGYGPEWPSRWCRRCWMAAGRCWSAWPGWRTPRRTAQPRWGRPPRCRSEKTNKNTFHTATAEFRLLYHRTFRLYQQHTDKNRLFSLHLSEINILRQFKD